MVVGPEGSAPPGWQIQQEVLHVYFVGKTVTTLKHSALVLIVIARVIVSVALTLKATYIVVTTPILIFSVLKIWILISKELVRLMVAIGCPKF